MACPLISHSSTSFFSFRILYGQEATTSTKIGTATFISYLKYWDALRAHAQEMDAIFAQARTKAQLVQDIQAARHHLKMGTWGHPPFWVGDIVWFDQRR